MKHIFVVKKGSFAIWKRLDPDGHVPKLSKHDFDPNEKSWDFILFKKIINQFILVIDENDDDAQEATGDNNTLFSEIQISGDIDEITTSGSAFDEDFRISRLRRPTVFDRRTASGLSTRSNSTINVEKVAKNSF